jgi:hypothetical protein
LFRTLAAALVVAAVCAAQPFDWRLPQGFPAPAVPPDNPMSAAKVELGRRLFYDPRLSINGTQSCATCHRQELAFTDGLVRANPNRSSILRPLTLTAREKADLIAFLHSLTDHEAPRDQRWSHPWPARLGAAAQQSQSFWSMTSVDLMTAVTVSPFFNPSSSALRRVMTLSITFFPTRTLMCAMTSPSRTSMIFPVNWFLADNGIPGLYHSSTPRGMKPRAGASMRRGVIQ